VDEKKFPHDLEPIVEKIHKKGYKAGIWLAPFVAETKSKLFQEHPEFFKTNKGKPIKAGGNWSGFYALDLEKEDVENMHTIIENSQSFRKDPNERMDVKDLLDLDEIKDVEIEFKEVDSNDNMAVYDKDYKNITGFNMKYDSLLEYELRSNINSIYLWKVGNNLVVVNNYLQDINKTEFSKGNAYFIKKIQYD